MKGWTPNYLRLGPHFILSIPLYEQLRRLFGADYMWKVNRSFFTFNWLMKEFILSLGVACG